MMSLSESSVDLQFFFRVSRSPNRLSRIALAMGSIMAVVAVLLSHMDKKAEVIIIPNMSLQNKTIPDQISDINQPLSRSLEPLTFKRTIEYS